MITSYFGGIRFYRPIVIGHIVEAVNDPEARRGMRTGRVSRAWAMREHRDWFDEMARKSVGGTDEAGR